jgi:ABC-type transport system substrate-binding protein
LLRWKKGKEIIFQKFANYHGKGFDIDKVYITIGYKDVAERFNQKKLDILGLFDGKIIKQITRKDISSKRIYQYTTWFLGFNLQRKLFNDENFRKAIYYAIDKKKLIEILGNKDSNTSHYLAPGFLFEQNQAASNDFNTETAKAYLAKVKLPKDFVLRMNIPKKYQELDRVVSFFKESFRRINVKVDIRILPLDRFIGAFIDKSYDFYVLELIPGYSDPDSICYPYFHSKGSFNVLNAHSAYLDNLLEKARYEISFEKRKELYRQIDSYLTSHHYIIPLYHENLDLLFNNSYENINISGLSIWFLKFKDIKIK